MLRARLLQAAQNIKTQQSNKGATALNQAMTPRQRFVKNWLSDSATYPIIGIMAAAIGLVVFQTQRIAFSHPDVTWSKSEREQTMRENDEAAEKHHEHWVRTRSRVGETQIMPGLNNLMVSGKVKN